MMHMCLLVFLIQFLKSVFLNFSLSMYRTDLTGIAPFMQDVVLFVINKGQHMAGMLRKMLKIRPLKTKNWINKEINERNKNKCQWCHSLQSVAVCVKFSQGTTQKGFFCIFHLIFIHWFNLIFLLCSSSSSVTGKLAGGLETTSRSVTRYVCHGHRHMTGF